MHKYDYSIIFLIISTMCGTVSDLKKYPETEQLILKFIDEQLITEDIIHQNKSLQLQLLRYFDDLLNHYNNDPKKDPAAFKQYYNWLILTRSLIPKGVTYTFKTPPPPLVDITKIKNLQKLSEKELKFITVQQIGNLPERELQDLIKNPSFSTLTAEQLRAVIANKNSKLSIPEAAKIQQLIIQKTPKREVPVSLKDLSVDKLKELDPKNIQQLNADQLKDLVSNKAFQLLNQSQMEAIKSNKNFEKLDQASQLNINVLLRRSAIAPDDEDDDEDEWTD